MSPQPSLFSLLVWLAVGHLIFSRIASVVSADSLYDGGVPKMTDVGNCVSDHDDSLDALNNCDFAAAAAAMAYSDPSLIKNIITDHGNGMATVKLFDYPTQMYYPITVSITNNVPASASQAPLGLRSSAVWPTVLQNAVIQLPEQAKDTSIASNGGFNGDLTNRLMVLGLLVNGAGQTLSNEGPSGTISHFDQWWNWAGTYTPCTSGADQTNEQGTANLNHDFVAVGCSDPTSCSFPSSSVTLYDPMFNGNPQDLFFQNSNGGTYGKVFKQDSQGYVKMTYKDWNNIFGAIWCAVNCPYDSITNTFTCNTLNS